VPQHTLANVFCQLRGAENSREADDTVKAVERTETADRLVTAATPGSPLLHLRVLLDLAESYRVAARSREADAAFSRAQDRLTALGYDQTETAETLFNNWALVLWELGRPLDAEALYRRAIAISSADGTDARVSAFVLNNLGRTLEELGRYDEAIDYSTRAYEKGRVAGNDVVIMQSLLARAASYRKRGHLAQAAQALDEVDRRANGRWGPTHPGYVSLTLERADLARARGELDEAARLFDRVIAVMETRPDKYALPRALLRRATLSLETSAGRCGPCGCRERAGDLQRGRRPRCDVWRRRPCGAANGPGAAHAGPRGRSARGAQRRSRAPDGVWRQSSRLRPGP
jgi:tetratricopeptide (TPR) repeat protein